MIESETCEVVRAQVDNADGKRREAIKRDAPGESKAAEIQPECKRLQRSIVRHGPHAEQFERVGGDVPVLRERPRRRQPLCLVEGDEQRAPGRHGRRGEPSRPRAVRRHIHDPGRLVFRLLAVENDGIRGAVHREIEVPCGVRRPRQGVCRNHRQVGKREHNAYVALCDHGNRRRTAHHHGVELRCPFNRRRACRNDRQIRGTQRRLEHDIDNDDRLGAQLHHKRVVETRHPAHDVGSKLHGEGRSTRVGANGHHVHHVVRGGNDELVSEDREVHGVELVVGNGVVEGPRPRHGVWLCRGNAREHLLAQRHERRAVPHPADVHGRHVRRRERKRRNGDPVVVHRRCGAHVVHPDGIEPGGDDAAVAQRFALELGVPRRAAPHDALRRLPGIRSHRLRDDVVFGQRVWVLSDPNLHVRR
mmetsp:Transcript_4165/g.13253  ORF Transcript_4165/g.13253 Transcript_4165/m.13253 type:complete len:418 (-) Transcript_4165:607-1860(-)